MGTDRSRHKFSLLFSELFRCMTWTISVEMSEIYRSSFVLLLSMFTSQKQKEFNNPQHLPPLNKEKWTEIEVHRLIRMDQIEYSHENWNFNKSTYSSSFSVNPLSLFQSLKFFALSDESCFATNRKRRRRRKNKQTISWLALMVKQV